MVRNASSVIDFQVSDRGRIRRPPVGRFQSELMRIEPIGLSLVKLLGAAIRERCDGPVGEVRQPQIMPAHEADPMTIGRELGAADWLRSADEVS